MNVKQISVFVENKSGRLAEVTKFLYEANINIRALSLADTADFGIIRLIVDKPDAALEVLRKNNFTVSETDVLAVRVEDKPGGLNKILTILDKHNINVEYMYAYVGTHKNEAIIIFRFDQIDNAIKVLTENGVEILKKEEVGEI